MTRLGSLVPRSVGWGGAIHPTSLMTSPNRIHGHFLLQTEGSVTTSTNYFHVCLLVGLLVSWLVGWSVGRSVIISLKKKPFIATKRALYINLSVSPSAYLSLLGAPVLGEGYIQIKVQEQLNTLPLPPTRPCVRP